MITEKEIKQVKDQLRSWLSGRSAIKVVYLGNYINFPHGVVIEAKARHATGSGDPYPFPKFKHCNYEIEDEDGDNFPISDDGIKFHEGFYPVPDDLELGSSLFKNKRR